MAKKKGLFSLLKRIFVSEANPEKQREKRRKWTFWRLKIRKSLPTITAASPPPPPTTEKVEIEQQEEQNKHALAIAPEVFGFTSSPQLDIREETEENSAAKTQDVVVDHQCEDQVFRDTQIEEISAIKIQTAFRGYLARKALHALKGIVKLQAYIRGRAVRRQTMTTLKCLQSVVNIQSQVCARRNRITEGASDEGKELHTLRDKIIKMDTNSQRRWDDSLLTKEEVESMVMNKKEAAIKRDRIREYTFAHRKSAESYQRKPNTRWKYWLDQWVDTQLSKSKELEDLDFPSNPKPKDEIFKDKQIKTPTSTSPRRSVRHKRQSSVGEDNKDAAFSSCIVTVPTYMAATESAKAKARSLSSPRIRPGSFDTQSESYSPYKNKLCLTTSIMSEAPSRVRVNTNRPSAYHHQRSPSLRGYNAGPVKSNRTTIKDLSLNSECSLPSWNTRGGFR